MKVIGILNALMFVALGVYSQALLVEPSTMEISKSTQPISYVSELSSSEFSISGTSTLNDWKSRVEGFSLKAVRDGNMFSVNLEVQVNSIKSGKEIMDNNTYRALKMEQNPIITLYTPDLTIEDNSVISGNAYLTIAGHTEKIPLVLNMVSWSQSTVTVLGEIPVKMTDYDVEPPVALFGAVKTGDDIVIKFNITLTANNYTVENNK